MWIKDQIDTFILSWKTCLYLVGNLCSLCLFSFLLGYQSTIIHKKYWDKLRIFLLPSRSTPYFFKFSLEYPSLVRLAQNASLFFRTILEYSYPSKLKILCNCGKVIETYYKSVLDMQKLNNFKVSLSHPAN